MTRNFQTPGRSAAYGTEAMIATSHPDAALVGIDILKRGGSAVDAAIAACAMLGVVEPAMTGIGGDCFAIVSRPGEAPVSINGSGRAPAGATIAAAQKAGAAIAEASPFAVTVPGAVDAWCALHARYGKLDLAALMEPAAARAEAGYAVAPRVAFDWARHAGRLAHYPETAAVFLPGGEAPVEGDVHRHPALARTLRAIGRAGRDAFYAGPVADELVRVLKGLGGVHTADDFARQTSDWEVPVSAPFAGVEVLECPPNGQGVTALLILKALDGWDAYRTAQGAQRLALLAGAMQAAYAFRDTAIADPAAMRLDVSAFLSAEAVTAVRQGAAGLVAKGAKLPAPPWESDTVYISVVDRDGMAVSFINSLFNAFGSTIYAPATGVLLHCRGTSFRLDPRHPNALAPGKRPMHTIIPGLVTEGGRALMPFGVMGGQYQAAGHAHFLSRLFQDGMDLQGAVDAPRLFGYQGVLEIEQGFGAETIAALSALGHNVQPAASPVGGAQAIRIDHARGVLTGASDPRKDGCALGY
jgi:gamma-glutamyltranspeptidase/glutathione hydrolase